MIQYRIYYDKDKEQIWLNQMVEKGWALRHFFAGIYTFVPCKTGEYIYQIDLLDNWKGRSMDYREFLEEMQIEMVDQWWRWVYLKKKTVDGPFELYTDCDSRIEQYKRIRNNFKILTIVVLLIILITSFCFTRTGSSHALGLLLSMILVSLVLCRMTFKTNRKVMELQNSDPGTVGHSWSAGTIPAGLLLVGMNSCMRRWYPVEGWLHGVLLVAACTLMISGMVMEFRKYK